MKIFLIGALIVGGATAAHASRTYNAYCDSPHGLTVGWIGPDRSTYEAAEADCRNHRNRFSSHSCAVG